jgi:hypothetical protein
MRNLLWLPLCGFLFLIQASAATIQYTETGPSAGLYTYHYTLTGPFTQYEVIDLSFDGSTTASNSLSGAVAGSDWNIQVLQPAAGGVPGDYYLESKVANPSVAGLFSINFGYTGSGTPGPQAYTLYQFDSNGNQIGVIGSGYFTTAFTGGTVPEPSSLWLSAVGLLALGVRRAIRRGVPPAA